jgi:hypothetical protein
VWPGRRKTDAALRPAFWQCCALGTLYVVLAFVLVTSLATQSTTVLLIALAELTAAYLAVFVSISGGHH